MNEPLVAIIILNYNGLADTVGCLNSLRWLTYPNYKIIVVDNGSDYGEAEALEMTYQNRADVILNDYNAGFDEGNNIGTRYAMVKYDPDYLLYLNNDTVVRADFVDRLVAVAEREENVGAVVGKIMLYDHHDVIESTGLGWSAWRGQQYRLNFRHKDNGRYNNVKEVAGASTNSFMVSREAWQKVGQFDSRYFIYHGDIDYCLRLRKAGYRILFVPNARIWHKVGASVRKSGVAYYYLARNNINLMRKHTSGLRWQLFLSYFLGFHVWFMAGVYLAYFRRLDIVRQHLRGVRDGLRGVTGKCDYQS